MKKILIVGGSGFIGRNIVEILLKSKKYNILATFYQKKNNQIVNKNIKYLKFDFKTNKNFDKIKKFDPHYIFFLAWNNIPNFSKKQSNINFNSSKNFLKRTKNFLSLKSVIYFGSCWEKLRSRVNANNYHFVDAKLKLKKYLDKLFYNSPVNVTWLRIFFVYGPYQKSKSLIPSLIDSNKKGTKINIKNPNLKNDFIHVYDLVNILKILISIKNAFKTIDVKTNTLVSVNSVKKRVNALANNTKIKKKNLIFSKPSKYVIPLSKNKVYRFKISLDKGIKSCL
jgi:UDP-glucuronate decarboxylase